MPSALKMVMVEYISQLHSYRSSKEAENGHNHICLSYLPYFCMNLKLMTAISVCTICPFFLFLYEPENDHNHICCPICPFALFSYKPENGHSHICSSYLPHFCMNLKMVTAILQDRTALVFVKLKMFTATL